MPDISRIPESMAIRPEDDELSAIFSCYPLKARIYSNPRVCGAWQLNPSGIHQAGFHLITSGRCWLHLGNEQRDAPAPVELGTGDLVFFTDDVWHMFSAGGKLRGDATDFGEEGGGDSAAMICGAIEFPTPAAVGFLRALPPLLHLRSGSQAEGDSLEMVSGLMMRELEAGLAGHSLILDRLSDILVLQVIRHALKMRLVRQGVLAAMADTRLLAAVLAIYNHPEHPWTLERLAKHAGLSRSILAQRFQSVVGATPMHHLAEVRMIRAELWLQEGRLSMLDIAQRLGYADEASLGRAFKRIRGYSPGSRRRHA